MRGEVSGNYRAGSVKVLGNPLWLLDLGQGELVFEGLEVVGLQVAARRKSAIFLLLENLAGSNFSSPWAVWRRMRSWTAAWVCWVIDMECMPKPVTGGAEEASLKRERSVLLKTEVSPTTH